MIQNYNRKINIFILILFLISLAIIFILLSNITSYEKEKFFSLSGALYGPKHELGKCQCTQKLVSQKLLSKQPIPIDECASCHLN